jgi:hypothetical protein
MYNKISYNVSDFRSKCLSVEETSVKAGWL